MKRLIALVLLCVAFQGPVLAATYRPLVNKSGVPVPIATTDTQQTPTSGSGNAAMNVPQGSAPSSPANGDVWMTSAGWYYRHGGTTEGPLSSGGTPGGSSGQIEYNNSGAFGGFTMANDCTFAVPNITCTKLNGVSPGSFFNGTSAANLTGTVPCSVMAALTGDVTTSSCAATIAANAVTTSKVINSAITYAKLQDASAASVLLGRGSASGSGPFQEITFGTGFSLSGTVLSAIGTGGTVTNVATSGGVTGGPCTTTCTISLAAIADKTALVNTSGGSAAPVSTTLSAWIDSALGSTRGSILERGASGWQIVTPGTTGFAYISNGAGADPSYQSVPSVGLPAYVRAASAATLMAGFGGI